MKLKELHALLQDVRPFEDPKVELEQYPTSAEIASRMLYAVDSVYDAIRGQLVVDLGCGTVRKLLFEIKQRFPSPGMLSIGAAVLGSPHVIGVDFDPDALDVAASNCSDFEDLPVDLLHMDLARVSALRMRPDTVVMNPPFGTRRKGADLQFLRVALQIAGTAVYSLHKSSTRAHVQKTAVNDMGAASAQVLAELRYDLPASYKFHKERSKDIQVDLWRFEAPRRPGCRAS